MPETKQTFALSVTPANPGDGKRVEGFSLAQARVVVQEGSLLRDNWGVVRGVGARGGG